MVGELSPWHIAIVLVVLVLLFGSTRLPDAARSLGRSLRIFKAEMNDIHRDEESTAPPRAPLEDDDRAPGVGAPRVVAPAETAASSDAQERRTT